MATKTEWPHRMTKGVLKGRTFKTQAEYQAALNKAQANGSSNGIGIAGTIRAYEALLEVGLGQKKAIEVLEKLHEM